MTKDIDLVFYNKGDGNKKTHNTDETSNASDINLLVNKVQKGRLEAVLSEFKKENITSHVWMLILGDLLSLILSFFILLYIDMVPSQELWDNIVASVNLKYKVKSFEEIERNMKKKSEPLRIDGLKNVYLEQVIKGHIDKYEGKIKAEVFTDNDGVVVSAQEKEIFLLNDYVDDDAKEFINFLASVLFNTQRSIKIRTFMESNRFEAEKFIDISNKCLRIVKFLRNATSLDNIKCEIKHKNNLSENRFEIIIGH